MQLYLNNDIDSSMWNRFAGENVFHRYEWRSIIESTYRMKPFFALAADENSFALYPAFLRGTRCVSMPFTYIAGYLSNCPRLQQLLAKSIRERYLDCYRTLGPTGNTPAKVTAIVEISDLESYVASLSHNMRNQMKKSVTQDLEFRRSRNLDLFYSLYCRKMHEHGTPPHKRAFFHQILDRFPEAEIFAALHQGSSVAAMFCIRGLDAVERKQPTLHILWAASDGRWDHLYVNYFNYWTTMQAAVESGIHVIDLGTTRLESTQHAFKRKWKPVFYAIQDHGIPTGDLINRKSAQMLCAIWRRSPGWLVDAIGPQLRKYLI